MKLNHLPHDILQTCNANAMVLRVSSEESGQVRGTTNFRPEDLRVVPQAAALKHAREAEKVHAITVCLFRLTPRLIEEATCEVEHRFQIMAELDTLLDHMGQVYVSYVVTHFNSRPLDELTIFIGGDCYRRDQPTFEHTFARTKDLASAMMRKAVVVFPDIPALHGGKKGEWMVMDKGGAKIDYLSDQSIVALGTVVIPKGIRFLNDFKELRAKQRAIFGHFPRKNFVRPDTGSPDVLSGPNWKQMCTVWSRRKVDLSYFTCMPAHFDGPPCPSSKPTGYGVAATAVALAKRHFGVEDIRQRRFLIEALGGVGMCAVEALVKRHGIPPENIIGFDPNVHACSQASAFHKITSFPLRNAEFYKSRLPSERPFDIWINNGMGDDVSAEHVRALLSNGVRVFCGAANNFFRVAEREESIARIFDAGAVAWPDEASSGGGWTLAVMDVYTRCQGKSSNTPEAENHILRTITQRNESLVAEVYARAKDAKNVGRAVWEGVGTLIDERIQRSLNQTLSPQEINAAANVKAWNLE